MGGAHPVSLGRCTRHDMPLTRLSDEATEEDAYVRIVVARTEKAKP